MKPTWCNSALYGDPKYGLGLLNNHIYKGETIWGRTRWEKDPDTKKKRRFLCEEHDWVRRKAEHLRIIDEALWMRVKQRQLAIHQANAAIRSVLHANARTGRRPKYLFSGLLICGQCGRKFVIVDQTRYGCSGWRYRGVSVCNNTIMASRKVVESELLAAIQSDLFTEDGYIIVKQEVTRLLAERRRTRTPDLAKAKARLHVMEQEIANLLTAIKAGIITQTTKAELEKLEAERDRLRVSQEPIKANPVATFLPNAIGRFKAMVEDLATTVT